MTLYAQHVSTKQTPQTEPIPGKPMVPNSAGGFGFQVDDWSRLDRFLILGAEGGTYYASEKKLTVENAGCVRRCLAVDPKRTVDRIVEISVQGRAPKNDPAIFALALAAADTGPQKELARALALAHLNDVCRIGTHLFQFNASVEQLRGRGQGLNRAVRNWYTSKTPDQLAYQLAKYQQRNGWSHRDLLRLVKPRRPDLDPLFRWCIDAGFGERDVKRMRMVGGKPVEHRVAHYPAVEANLPRIVDGFERAKVAKTGAEVAGLIREYGLPRECVPTQFLTEAAVWEALLPKMPMTAMIRNLATMTRVGLIAPMSAGMAEVINQLRNAERLRKSRVHPLAVLTAMRTYASGKGDKGQNTWTPVQSVVDALDGAFYESFPNVRPTGKRWVLGIDVSASMGGKIAGSPLSCCEAATALALVTTHVEPFTFTGRFNEGFQEVPFGNKTRLDDALRYTRNINGGGTDCALPMVYALEKRIQADVFVVLTDNETWAGRIHPVQALAEYRRKMGIPAKLIVVGMTATQFSIADPADNGMLDVVGFDTATPAVMSEFVGYNTPKEPEYSDDVD